MPGVTDLQAGQGWVRSVEALLAQESHVVAVAVAAVVLSGGLFWVVRHLRRPPAARLRKLLAARDEIAVVTHPNPDPDAMASAVGVKHIAERAGAEATIQYPGQIRHQENRAFRTVLDLNLDRIETAGDLAPGAVVLVDHNRPRGFEGADGVEPYAVVDHHPGTGEGTAFTDVRPDLGSCSSIVAEYFEDLGAKRYGPDDEEPAEPDHLTLPSDVATGLLYGIQSDTNHLTRGCSRAEFEASAYLYPAVDESRLDRIANPQVDAEVLEVQRRAIAERDTRPPYAVSDVGPVDNLDAIPQAADELMYLEGITAVVVLGEKNRTLHLSGRSRDDRVHVGRALEAAVDGIPMAGAGGHARMGGGQVSIDHMNGIGPSNGFTRAEFHDRLFDALAGTE